MHVYARYGLAAPTASTEPALLLEGSWPCDAPSRWALDDELDSRHARIDDEAERLGRLAAGLDPCNPEALPPVSLAWLNALPLRYWLIKVVRVAAWLDANADRHDNELIWHLEADRDDDYAALAGQIAARRGRPPTIVWHPRAGFEKAATFPPNNRWRKLASRFCGDRRSPRACRDARPRVVLAGNARILDPVCDELLGRGCRVWWLYDRFAAGSWLHWRRAGARQLVCDSSEGSANRLPARLRASSRELITHGLNLAPLVDGWLAGMAQSHGPRQTRLVDQTAAHFQRVHPTHLLVDEDATPLPRAAIAAIHAVGGTSAVVQNAATGIPFGFTSFAADRIFAWGETSRRRLADWGFPAERIALTGSPWHDALRRRLRPRRRKAASSGPRILLLATPPARDARPDIVAYHKTSRSYHEMVSWCFEAAARVAGARMTVKLHPRATTAEPFASLSRAHATLPLCITHTARLEDVFAESDIVLSLGSSAGTEAALAGLPVVQVMPAGSADLLPAEPWGMLGTARSLTELQALLAAAQSAGPPCIDPRVFGDLDRPAAATIADLLFADRKAGSASLLRRPTIDDSHAGDALRAPHYASERVAHGH